MEAGGLGKGDETRIRAVHRALTITPERSRAFLPPPVSRGVRKITTAMTPMLPRKARAATPGKGARPRRMPMIAPTAAPPEIPRI
jgi:hypothetical protein